MVASIPSHQILAATHYRCHNLHIRAKDVDELLFVDYTVLDRSLGELMLSTLVFQIS
jgi:hypothetical protein